MIFWRWLQWCSDKSSMIVTYKLPAYVSLLINRIRELGARDKLYAGGDFEGCQQKDTVSELHHTPFGAACHKAERQAH